MNEQERIMLTIILGKIKNDLERVGDIDKLLDGVEASRNGGHTVEK